MKPIISNTKGQLDINLAVTAILGLILASAFLVIGIVVLQGVVDGGDIDAGIAGTTTYTATGVAVNNETITIGSEIYTVSNTTSGAFYILNATNASNQIAYLVTEINANSTLVTAGSASAANASVITSVLASSTGNYASTENMTNGAFTGTAMTGGVDADSFYDTMTSVASDIGSAMALAGTLILVIIGVAILMLLAGVMVIMRAFR